MGSAVGHSQERALGASAALSLGVGLLLTRGVLRGTIDINRWGTYDMDKGQGS